ncbi:gsr0392 [Gloeobacter violaceus PCC 7421]|uniref:Gsr0392 protein n=1 Tax=Gloeobacter violaceus (strain ATCC 29082 / PCC 7421) TaxID=251221 RepID=Q7NNL9_GLOVI|nr:gsr0392 [Gloeobacter violaceus PCC 7421]
MALEFRPKIAGEAGTLYITKGSTGSTRNHRLVLLPAAKLKVKPQHWKRTASPDSFLISSCTRKQSVRDAFQSSKPFAKTLGSFSAYLRRSIT